MRDVKTGEFDGGSVFIDGDWRPLSEAKISLFDWGFTRSNATYDVASVWKGAFFRLNDHLDRFFASLDTLHMRIPHARAEVRDILHGCVRGGGLQDAYMAMVCTRGVPPRGTRDPRLAVNRFYAYALPFVWIAPPDKQLAGIDLHVSARQRIGSASVDPTVKNYHWLDLVLSLYDAYDRGADTSCVVDAQGNIAEGPGFNVFVVERGVVRTPDRGVLEGISRRTVIDGIALPGGVPGPVTKRLEDACWALHDETRRTAIRSTDEPAGEAGHDCTVTAGHRSDGRFPALGLNGTAKFRGRASHEA